MQIYNFIVETTRRCNMKCPHCLRGEPQNKTMKKEYLYRFLKQIKYISTVTFTGGEPTLPSGMKVMQDFMETCNHLNVLVGNFYFVTNAKVWRPKLPSLVNDLYNFCEENDVSSIEISTDQFHERIRLQRNSFKFCLEEELYERYGIENLIGMRKEIQYHQLLHEGRAVNISSGRQKEVDDLMVRVYYNDEIAIEDGNVYLNCDGNIINGCNWSYESQKDPKNIICSIYDDFESVIKIKANVEYDEEIRYG